MSLNTYDLDTLLQIRKQMTKIKLVTVPDGEITMIKNILNERDSDQIENQKKIKASAVVVSKNVFVPMHMQVTQNVKNVDSPEYKLQQARLSFNRLNKNNVSSVAHEMKKNVDNHAISDIFFDAILSLMADQPEKFDVWEYWILLLPELNKNNDEFKKNIVKDTYSKFDSLIQKKSDSETFQKFGCWLSCLLVSKFINSNEYSSFLHKVIQYYHLNVAGAVSVIHSSLIISGKTIDDKKCPLYGCWFLFTFLKMKSSQCPNYIKFKVIDLFELRKYDYDKKRLQSELEGSKNTSPPKYKPATWENFSNKFNEEYEQKEFWEGQFTSYGFHRDNYKVPKKISGTNQLVTKSLLSLYIKQKGKNIDDFLEFSIIVLDSIFNGNPDSFLNTMIQIKSDFRKVFEKEEITIFNENHIRFYKLIAQFVMDKITDLYDYIKTLFNVYLHINDYNTFDQIISPLPSAFIELIYQILGTDEYLTPEQCNNILSQFPKDVCKNQENFNKFAFQNQDYPVFKKVKKSTSTNTPNSQKILDDFYPFLSQLAYDTNPELADKYFSEKEDSILYSYYDRLLFLYNKFYKYMDEENGSQIIINMGEDSNFIRIGIEKEDQKNVNYIQQKLVSTALKLLVKDDIITKERKKELEHNILKDVVGEA